MPELLTPRNAQEAADILQRATAQGKTVECAGARTRFDHGNRPAEPDIILSSEKMTAVAEYEPADLVIGVESGATLPQIESVVKPNNQFLALDPAVADVSTVGAVVATSSTGPMRFAHGTPRDQVLGLEMVSGDGRILHFGGRVVKNVAGYDVVRLMTGSRGTLGFITRLHLRLKPLPQVDRTLTLSADSFSGVADAVDAMLDAHLEPVAIEIVSSGVAGQLVGGASWVALARFQGNADAVAAGMADAQKMAAGLTAAEHDTQVWRRLSALEAGAPVRLRFANLRSHLRDTTTAALRVAQETRCSNARLIVHGGEGIVRLLADSIDSNSAVAINAEREAIHRHGGSLIIERANIEGVDAYGHNDSGRLMAAIKKIFDPAGILGVGRFDI